MAGISRNFKIVHPPDRPALHYYWTAGDRGHTLFVESKG